MSRLLRSKRARRSLSRRTRRTSPSYPTVSKPQTPDEFLCNLFDLDPDRIMIALEKICTRRERQPNDVLALVDATLCPQFVALVGELLAGVDTER